MGQLYAESTCIVAFTPRVVLDLACERRRISGCRFSPPEIRVRSQAILDLKYELR